MSHEPPAIAPSRLRPARYRLWLVPVLLFLLLIAADQSGWLLVRQIDDRSAYHGKTVPVINALSGDLIEVDAFDALHDRPTTFVRLLGIAAPQPPRPGREPEEHWDLSLEFIASLVVGREIVLNLDAHRTRDQQGALLAHVEMPDGSLLNETMLDTGLARRDERWSHSMLTAYAQAENRARRTATGVWSQH